MAKFGGGDDYQLQRKVELGPLKQTRCLQVLRAGQEVLVKVLKKLANVIVLIPIIFERLWQSDGISSYWKKTNVTSIIKARCRKRRDSHPYPASLSEKIIKQIFQSAISGMMKGKELVWKKNQNSAVLPT